MSNIIDKLEEDNIVQFIPVTIEKNHHKLVMQNTDNGNFLILNLDDFINELTTLRDSMS